MKWKWHVIVKEIFSSVDLVYHDHLVQLHEPKVGGQTIANCYSIIMTWPLLQLLQLV